MGNRLSQIATRTGDDGTTGLGDGSRTSKDSLRIAAMGDVDELNSMIGLLLAEPMPEAVRDALVAIQHDLFDLGGELCIPGFENVADAQVARLDELLGALQRRPAAAAGVHPARRVPRGGDAHMSARTVAGAPNARSWRSAARRTVRAGAAGNT